MTTFIDRHPWVIVIIFALSCAGAAAMHSANARYDMSYRTMAPQSTPEFAEFEEFIETFGLENDTYVIALRSEPLVTERNLHLIDRITRAVEELTFTRSAVSLTNVQDIQGRDDSLEVLPFVEEIPQDPGELRKLVQRFTSDPIVAGTLISKDATTTAIVVRVPESQMEFDDRFAYFDAVEGILAENNPGDIHFHIVGYPYAGAVLLRYMVEDTAIFIPLTMLLMSAVLWFTFGRLRATFMPLVPVFVAATLTLGLLTGTGYPMSLLTGQGVLTTLILVIGLSDGIHLLNRYDEDVALGGNDDRSAILHRTIRHVGTACFLTSLTTGIGFLTLALADVPSVRDFGLFGAAGIFFAYIGAVVLLPAMLVIADRRGPLRPHPTATSGALDRLLAATAEFVIRRPRSIVAAAFLILLASSASIPNARIDNGVTRDLKSSAPAVVAIKFLEENLGGVYPLDIVFRGEGADSVKDPALLAAADTIAAELVKSPHVSTISSPVEFIKKMNLAMHNGAPDQNKLPDSPEAVAQYLLLFEMAGGDNEFDRLVNYDYSVARMTAMTNDLHPEEYEEVVAEIERLKALHLPPNTQLYPSGESPVWQTAGPTLITTLVRSLYLAMPLIFIVTGIAFRSAKLGILSAFPNMLPITIALGLMAPLDITLRFSTITAFPMAFGLAIDDTIHFLTRYRLEIGAGRSPEDAVRRTMATSGRAMFVTSALLVAGFSVMFFSNFLGLIHVALLCCVILLAALLGDLLVLPALLLIVRPRIADSAPPR